MPRSHRMGGFASAVEEEEEVICPYNKQHRIPVSLIQQHLAVCRKGLQAKNGSDVRVCPYNRNHHVSAAKYNEHVENCPDASFEGDDGYGRDEIEPRKQRNGHAGYESRGDQESRNRPSHFKQSSASDSRHVEQVAAPKGCKIGKGFGFTKEHHDTGNFVRERSFRNPKNENENYDDSSGFGGRSKKAYTRSKSNLDMNEESVRRAQRDVVDQVREFQNTFNQQQRASASRYEESDRFTRAREPESFTKAREPPSFGKMAPPVQVHQRDFGYEEPPVERIGGYGRGKKVVEHEEIPRPGGLWSRIKSEEYVSPPEYKEEPPMNRDTGPASGRFKITKASNVFGPIEAAPPVAFVDVGKRISSTIDEEDWGTEKVRTFAILKPRDVFQLDDMDSGDRRGRPQDGNFVRDHHYGNDSMARPNRRFDVKHPDEVFSNRRDTGATRFAGTRSPPETREPKKAELPWPFNRFAENTNLGRRNEDEMKTEERFGDDEKQFPKTDSNRTSPMNESRNVVSPFGFGNGITRNLVSPIGNEIRRTISPIGYEMRNAISPIGNGNGVRNVTSPSMGNEEEEEFRSNGHSECEILSVSSGGGRASKRLESASPAWEREGSETSEMATAAAAMATGAKPKVLSIYEQYEQFGLDDDDLNFLKPAETVEPLILPDPSMGAIFAHLRNFGLGTSPAGVVQSPAFGSSHSSSPYSFAP